MHNTCVMKVFALFKGVLYIHNFFIKKRKEVNHEIIYKMKCTKLARFNSN